MTDVAAIVRDAEWLAHRYDPVADAVHFLKVPRALHRTVTFITDEYLPADLPLVPIDREQAVSAARPIVAPVHYIFHSAYCCSTLLARAVDRPGASMGLKEPRILQDIEGWRQRGGDPRKVAAVLDSALTLLARPFAAGEAIVVKPSNIVNPYAAAMLGLRQNSRALLLHAPLRGFLASIAKKGMWGRLWVRELFTLLEADGLIDLGFEASDYMRQTDLQIAATGWLAQHKLFASLAARFPDRVRTLDSETLLAHPGDTIASLSALMALGYDADAIAEIASGPAFARHSKFGTNFGSDARADEQRDAAEIHADEIEKVAIWADAVAGGAGIAMTLPAPLF